MKDLLLKTLIQIVHAMVVFISFLIYRVLFDQMDKHTINPYHPLGMTSTELALLFVIAFFTYPKTKD